MTGVELLERYAKGERDFRGAWLVGARLDRASLDGASLDRIKGKPAACSLWLGLRLGWNGPILVGKTYRCRECGCERNEDGYTDALVVEQFVGWAEDGTLRLAVVHAGNNAYPTNMMTVEEAEGRTNV